MCEENNKCYKFEVKSKFKQTDITNFDHELFIFIDLLQAGFDKEFHLKADTKYNANTFKHDFETRLKSKDNLQYIYKVYIDKSKANVELVLPKRTMAIEGVYKLPSKSLLGTYEVSISSYLDKKNEPKNKATLALFGTIDLTEDKRLVTYGEFKCSHPSVKELRLIGKSEFNKAEQKATGTLEIDIFKNNNQAIILNGSVGNNETGLKRFNITCAFDVKSQGLGFEYGIDGHAAASLDRRQFSASGTVTSAISDLRASAYIFGAEDKIELAVNGFNEEILNIDFQHKKDTHQTNLKATAHLLGSKPLIGDFSASDLKSFKASIVRDKLFNINGEITVGKGIILNVLGASDKEIFKGTVGLDESNFLLSEYKVNENEFKSFVVPILTLLL